MKSVFPTESVIRVFAFLMLSLTAVSSLHAQMNVTMQQAIDSAVKRSPSVQASALQVIQSRQLQKSSVSIPNPEVTAESPTGEFYTIGVQQSFDFPGTYIRQQQYQREQTKLAGFGQAISQLEVKRETAFLYVNVQYQQALVALLARQDSVYRLIRDAAVRTFEAGKLDYLQKVFAESQYGEIHLQYTQAVTDYEAAQEQLTLFTGIPVPFRVDSMRIAVVTEKPELSLSANPYLGYFGQLQIANRRLLQVERNRFLPGFMIGYMNQGAMNTPVGYRFRAGITIPLWFWQYTGRIQAAQTGMRVSAYQAEAQTQQLSSQLIAARAQQLKSASALIYYEGTGLVQADGIESAARRLFSAGETDYITHLRTMNEAYTIRLNHLEAVKNYTSASIQLNYLSGNL